MKRSINIGHTHLAYYAGYEAGVVDTLELEYRPKLDTLIFPIILQAGIDHINFTGHLPDQLENSDYIKGKCKVVDFKDLSSLHLHISELIRRNLQKDFKESESDHRLWQIEFILTEIIYAISKKSSMLMVTDPPDLKEFRNVFNPAFLVSLELLFSKFESIEVNVPVPEIKLLHKDAKIFYEILESDHYVRFSNSFLDIENSNNINANLVKNVNERSDKLISHFTRELSPLKKKLRILPLSVNIISLFTSIIPSGVSTILDKAITLIEEEKNTLTIYNASKYYAKIVDDHYINIAIKEGKFPGLLKNR